MRNTLVGLVESGPENHSGGSLSFSSVVTCLNVLLPCLAHFEAGGPSKPAAVHTHLLPSHSSWGAENGLSPRTWTDNAGPFTSNEIS